MAVIATAEVRVVADTSRFVSDLRRKLRSAFSGTSGDLSDVVAKAFDGVGDRVATSLERQIESRVTPRLERSMERSGRQAASAFDGSFQSILDDIDRRIIQAGERARKNSGRIAEGMAAGLRQARPSLIRAVDDVLSNFDDRLEQSRRRARENGGALMRSFSEGVSQSRNLMRSAADDILNDFDARLEQSRSRVRRSGFAFMRNFSAGLERGRDQIAQEAAEAAKVFGDSFSKAFSRTPSPFVDSFLEGIDQRQSQLNLRMRRSGFQSVSAFRQGIAQAQDQLSRDSDELGNSIIMNLQRAEGPIRARARRIGNFISTHIGGGSNLADRAVSRLGSSLRNLMIGITLRPLQALGNLFSDFSQTVAAAGAMTVLFIGVIIQLSGILGPLPALLSLTAAAITTAAFAFRGIGEAFSASLGNAEAFEEAIEDLAPAAQNVVREFRAFRGAFSDLRLDAQQALWSELEGTITAVGQNLGGVLREGVIAASGAMGRLVAGIGDFLAESATAETVNETFSVLTGLLDEAADEMQPLLRGMREIVDEFLPRFQDLEDTIDGIGGRFERWAEAITAPREELDGASQAMDAFDRSIEFISQVGRIVSNVFRVVGAIFSATADNGVNLLGTIEALTENLAEMAESPEGQEGLANFFDNLDRIVAQLLPLVGTLLSELGELAGPVADLLERARPHIERFFERLSDGIKNFLDEGGGDFIVELFDSLADIDWEQLGTSIGKAFKFLEPVIEFLQGAINLVIDIVLGIGTFLGWIDSIGDTLSDFFSSASDAAFDFRDWWEEFWIFTVPGAIWDGLSWAGEAIVSGLASLLEIIMGWVDSVRQGWSEFWDGLGLNATSFFSGITEESSLSLSGLTSVFTGWGDGILTWWSGLFGDMNLGLLGAFTNFDETTTSGTSSIRDRLTGWGSGISSWWSNLWSGFTSTLSSRWKQATSTVSGAVSNIRGSLADLRSFFSNAFKAIVSSIATAFSSISGYASRISSAISSIPSLPSFDFSLPSFFADGGIVYGPTNAVVGEAGPEAILPLTRPDRAVEIAVQAGIPQLLARAGFLGPPAATGADGRPIEVHMHTQNTDVKQVARQTVRMVQRELRGRGLERIR